MNLRNLAGIGAVEDWPMWNMLGPGIMQPAADDQCARSQLARNTAIWTTARAVTEHATGSIFAPPVPAVIWASQPGSFNDALGFWNARALVATSSPVSPVIAVLLPPDISLWPDFISLLAPHFQARDPRPGPDAFIFSHSVPAGQLHILREQLQLDDATAAVDPAHAAPGNIDREPDPGASPGAAVGIDPTPWCCYPRTYGTGIRESVQVFSGQTAIRAPSPVPFRFGTGGWVQVSLSGLRAFAVPRRQAVARLFRPDARFEGDRLCLSRPTANFYEIELTIPEPPAVLAAALQQTGLTFTLSDKGDYAQALLDQAPGIQGLLRQPGVLEVIIALTRQRTARFKDDLEALLHGQAGGSEHIDGILALARERLPLPHRSVAELPHGQLSASDTADILEQLASLGLCSRGFAIDCKACHIESFIELSVVSGQPACPACRTVGKYRPDSQSPSGPAVRYRLSSLLDRASDQGAPPHILGLDCLEEHAAGRPLFVLPGALLRDGETELGEVDLLGYVAQRLIVGEVKTSAVGFTEKQVKKDLSLAALVGADTYVMIAVDAISADQETMAPGLAAKQGCGLLAFSGESARPATPS